MTTVVEVHVAIDNETRRAGSLYAESGRRTETATFVYDGAYIASRGAYAFDPALALDAAPHHTRQDQKLFGAFADCAPDRWGRTLLQRTEQRRAREAGTSPRRLTEVDFLLGVRDDLRQGALRFRIDANGEFLADEDRGVPALTQLPELLELAARADRDSANYDELRRLVRAGSSLGGARPKAHVVASDGRLAIAKFPSSSTDTWNVMAWEKVAHDLARDAGITVPNSELINVDGRSVHVIDRFDRRGDERIGYISATTMLEASDGETRSYLEIAAAIEQESRRATEDLRELWRRIAFTVLISNTDDHLRNHGFLHAGSDAWILSPAFDMNPNPEPGPKELCCAIDDSDTTASVVHLREVADYFRLDDGQARAVLNEVAAAVVRWREVAREYGLTEHDIEDMAPAFEHSQAAAALA
jgi:serine/threonine-protein kinase HipA